MPRLLIIDDDRDLTAMLVEYLEPEGFLVEVTHSGEDGLAQALAAEYALIILDVMLPALGGLEVLRRLRTQSQCPVIMLTARGQEIDRIVGLEIGADDYLAKPFSARELLARMHRSARRSGATRRPHGADRAKCARRRWRAGGRSTGARHRCARLLRHLEDLRRARRRRVPRYASRVRARQHTRAAVHGLLERRRARA